MLSEKQKKTKMANVKCVVDLFLNSNKYIDELAEMTHISASSIQRYLNDIDYIQDIYEDNANEVLGKIKSKLLRNKEQGNIKGGVNYSKENKAIKDSSGHFIGSRKR